MAECRRLPLQSLRPPQRRRIGVPLMEHRWRLQQPHLQMPLETQRTGVLLAELNLLLLRHRHRLQAPQKTQRTGVLLVEHRHRLRHLRRHGMLSESPLPQHQRLPRQQPLVQQMPGMRSESRQEPLVQRMLGMHSKHRQHRRLRALAKALDQARVTCGPRCLHSTTCCGRTT